MVHIQGTVPLTTKDSIRCNLINSLESSAVEHRRTIKASGHKVNIIKQKG